MPRASILSDELVRQLVAVGQVDVLVGVPTFNHAATIEAVVKAIHVGLARHFPRERTVLVNADGGSDDGTVERLHQTPMAPEELRGSTTLRTTHRVSARYPGLPGRAGGVRTVFAAADLLQARAVVVIDPDLTPLTTEWIAELARPIWNGDADLVLPIPPRRRFDGPLPNQLVRPLLGAAYGRRLRTTATGTFGCSGAFAAGMAMHPMWEGDLTQPAFDVWLLASALAEDARLEQVHLGLGVAQPRAARAGLPELFQQVVGTTFHCLDLHAPAWLPRNPPRDLPVHGRPCDPDGTEAPPDLAPLAERFRSGVRDLAPVLREILTPETLARLQAAATASEDPPGVPDPLWVTTVYEFAASAHRGVMNREHLTQALVSLYLGRTASFFAEIASADETAHRERLEALEHEYEAQRPYLLERWNAEGGR